MRNKLLVLIGLALALGLILASSPVPGAEKGETEAGLPPAARGFAGMIQAKVVKKVDGSVTVTVEKITKTWEHSKAKDPRSMVGKRVNVLPSTEGRHSALIPRFLEYLKIGEEASLDVANRKGNDLILLELSKEQQKRTEK